MCDQNLICSSRILHGSYSLNSPQAMFFDFMSPACPRVMNRGFFVWYGSTVARSQSPTEIEHTYQSALKNDREIQFWEKSNANLDHLFPLWYLGLENQRKAFFKNRMGCQGRRNLMCTTHISRSETGSSYVQLASDLRWPAGETRQGREIAPSAHRSKVNVSRKATIVFLLSDWNQTKCLRRKNTGING